MHPRLNQQEAAPSETAQQVPAAAPDNIHPMIYLIRGLPGSGKTTLARKLNAHLIEADQYFVDPHTGIWTFDPNKLPEAHAWCFNHYTFQLQARHALAIGNQDIAVANTFVKLAHLQPYIDLANKLEFKFNVIECKGRFKSIHNVPEHTIERMRREFETYNP